MSGKFPPLSYIAISIGGYLQTEREKTHPDGLLRLIFR